jgi:polyhydroxybutyrate depolymerase
VNIADGCTAVRYLYSGGNSASSVELYKITGGGHTWPGFPFGGVGTNMDFNASVEIWRSFNKYTLSSLTSISENEQLNKSVRVYPNPTNSILHFDFNTGYQNPTSIEIVDLLGKVVFSEPTIVDYISIENLNPGLYFISIKTNDSIEATVKFIKN